jgi:hypothetical protein
MYLAWPDPKAQGSKGTAFPQERFEDLQLKDLFQRLHVECEGYPLRSAFKVAAIGAEHMEMGIEVENIPKSGFRLFIPRCSVIDGPVKEQDHSIGQV